jgi:hypothetical protein
MSNRLQEFQNAALESIRIWAECSEGWAVERLSDQVALAQVYATLAVSEAQMCPDNEKPYRGRKIG